MMILVLLVRAAFSTIFPVGRVAVQVSGPIFFTGVRFLISGLLLLGYEWWQRGRLLSAINTRIIAFLCIVTVFGLYLTNVPECWALLSVPSAKAAFLYSLSPFYAALLAYAVLGERLTRNKMLGMSIGFAGFVVMVLNESPAETPTGGIGYFSAGEMALVVAAIATTIGWIGMRQLVRDGESSIAVNGIAMLLCGIAAIATSPALETWAPLPVTNYTTFGICLVLAIVFPNLIGYTLCGHLLKQYTTTLIAFSGFTDIFFAAIYGWLFLGEGVSWQLYLASGIVFSGLYLFCMEELRQGYVVHT